MGLDPFGVMLGMYSILKQCQDNERAVLGRFLASKAPDQPTAPAEAEAAPVADPGAFAADAMDLGAIGAEA